MLPSVSKITPANIQGGLPKNGGLAQFADLRGAWQERQGWCFLLGTETPVHTMRVLPKFLYGILHHLISII